MTRTNKKATRKQRYKEFLKSEFWLLLSAEQKRLFPTCKDCGAEEKLQAHHIHYQKDWFDTKLSDLVTLCRDCHRFEHGLWVRMEIDDVFDRIRGAIYSGTRPAKEDWKFFKREQKYEFAAEMFASLMMLYCGFLLRKDMDTAFAVRDSILCRHKRWEHLAKNSEWRRKILGGKELDAIITKHSGRKE